MESEINKIWKNLEKYYTKLWQNFVRVWQYSTLKINKEKCNDQCGEKDTFSLLKCESSTVITAILRSFIKLITEDFRGDNLLDDKTYHLLISIINQLEDFNIENDCGTAYFDFCLSAEELLKKACEKDVEYPVGMHFELDGLRNVTLNLEPFTTLIDNWDMFLEAIDMYFIAEYLCHFNALNNNYELINCPENKYAKDCPVFNTVFQIFNRAILFTKGKSHE